MSNKFHLPDWNVLIIENDPLVQLWIEQFFADHSQLTVVDCVDDGYLAVEMALQSQPDLILMDIGLPGQDGIAATQQIKADRPEIKVIMLTSHTSETKIFAALASGADAYCVKGGGAEILLTAISAVYQGASYLDPQIARQVMQEIKTQTVAATPINLSEREFEVLTLLVEGYSNPKIATQLLLSPNTVKVYVRSLMNKLAVSDRVQLAVKALRTGLV